MGSNRLTIGNRAAKSIASFTAAADSGPLLYHVHPAGTQPYDWSEIRGCNEFTVGLAGNGTGLKVTLYFTTDRDTAAGVATSPVWFVCPSPSTEAASQWSNPMYNIVGQNALHFKANAIALRAVAEADGSGNPITGTTTVLLLGSF